MSASVTTRGRLRLVVPARLTAQAGAWRQLGRDLYPGHDRQEEARGPPLRVGYRHFDLPLRLRLAERPDPLVAVRVRDRHTDARVGAVGMTLVVERDRDLREAPSRHRPDVSLAQAEHRREQRA